MAQSSRHTPRAERTRAAILDVLRSAYVEMALLKGVPKGRIILRHALPNALSPVINVVAINLGYLVSGVVLVEAIFSYPGLGRLIFEAVGGRDFPVMQAGFLLITVAVLLSNLLADFLYPFLDPRTKGQ